jgi:hypothetical protein
MKMNTMLEPDQTTKEAETVERAVAAFRRQTGIPIDVRHEVPLTPTRRADTILTLQPTPDKEARYIAEIKRTDRFAALGAIKAQLDAAKLPYPGLLVTQYLAPQAVDQCLQMGLHFLDTAGNAYLKAEGLYVLIKGQPKPQDDRALLQAKATTATGLRVAFVLLCDEDLLNAPYRRIAKAANVALGTIGWVFFDWQQRGMATGGQKTTQPRVLLERRKLLDDWVANYPARLRPKLNAQRFTAPNRDWWKTTNIREFDAIWGGEIAADRYTNDLRPATVTIYMNEATRTKNAGNLIKRNRLRPDPDGEIEILDQFWTLDKWNGERPDLETVVPPLLVYADLIATNDPRNIQVARAIYEPWLFHDNIAPGKAG